MFRRVVVPLDGSKLAEGIVPFLAQIAGPLDLQVTLLRVLEPIMPQVTEGSRHVVVEDVPARTAEALAYLRRIADTLAARGVQARTAVRRGPAVAEIVAEAREVDADLIAMTTHGRGGLGRLLFGSVAEAVLRQAELPVFLLRLTEKQAAALPGLG